MSAQAGFLSELSFAEDATKPGILLTLVFCMARQASLEFVPPIAILTLPLAVDVAGFTADGLAMAVQGVFTG